MKAVKIITLLIILAAGIQFQAFGRDIKKEVPKKGPAFDFELKSKDTLEKDILKILPAGSVLAHPVTEGIFGPADASRGPILIAPYRTGKNGMIQLMLLVPSEKGKYRKMTPGTITFKAMKSAEIESVFFDQSDKDKERELFILCTVTYVNNTSDYETAVFSWEKTRFVRKPAFEPRLKGQYPAINVRKVLRDMEARQEKKAARDAKSKLKK